MAQGAAAAEDLTGCRSSGRGTSTPLRGNKSANPLAGYVPSPSYSTCPYSALQLDRGLESIHAREGRPARSVAPACALRRAAEPSLPRHVRSGRRRRRWQRRTQRQQHLSAVPGHANQVLVSGCTRVGMR